MTDFFPNSLQGRELDRARHEREAEDEVEDVGLREQLRERAPLGRLAAREAARAVERDVGLGVERVALEDDEPRVDAAAPERLGGRPRDAGRVDRAERDAERPALASRAGVAAHGAVAAGALVESLRCSRESGSLGAHRWMNAGSHPARCRLLTRDTLRGTVPVPPGGWGLGMGQKRRRIDDGARAPHASGVPLELVEVAQRRPPGPDPRPRAPRARRPRSRRAPASRRGTGC